MPFILSESPVEGQPVSDVVPDICEDEAAGASLLDEAFKPVECVGTDNFDLVPGLFRKLRQDETAEELNGPAVELHRRDGGDEGQEG